MKPTAENIEKAAKMIGGHWPQVCSHQYSEAMSDATMQCAKLKVAAPMMADIQKNLQANMSFTEGDAIKILARVAELSQSLGLSLLLRSLNTQSLAHEATLLQLARAVWEHHVFATM